MKRLLALLMLAPNGHAAPYIEVGLGVPLSPETGYIPDQYGILGFGYRQHLKGVVSIDIGAHHRSLTGSEAGKCPHRRCGGDNAVEAKLILEFK